MPCSAASATTSSIGWRVPTSLLAHITEISGDRAGVALDGGAQRVDVEAARAVDRQQLDLGAARRSPSQCSGSSTAWCSIGGGRGCGYARGSAPRRDQKMPLSARLSASVPPEVNTTSPGRQSSACAIVSRDSSTTRRARRPEACSELGLPTSSEVGRHRLDGRRAASAWSRRGRGRRSGWSSHRQRTARSGCRDPTAVQPCDAVGGQPLHCSTLVDQPAVAAVDHRDRPDDLVVLAPRPASRGLAVRSPRLPDHRGTGRQRTSRVPRSPACGSRARPWRSRSATSTGCQHPAARPVRRADGGLADPLVDGPDPRATGLSDPPQPARQRRGERAARPALRRAVRSMQSSCWSLARAVQRRPTGRRPQAFPRRSARARAGLAR